MSTTTTTTPPDPTPLRWILSFLLVGAAWGITNPFIRRAAVQYQPPAREFLTSPTTSAPRRAVLKAAYAALDLVRTPSYFVPLLINLSGSVWFFLLIGSAELSLMVPIVNSLAFLFTVLGDWLATRKAVTREVAGGVVLVCGGIWLCVQSKNA